jgi:UDPglucose 6-dehydrogenase
MDILMIGTGYVGLVTAALFSEMGHQVICLDIDRDKIEKLRQGDLPFFEPGLQEIVSRNVLAGRLSFTSDYQEGVSQSQVCFIAVQTPSLEGGSCDLSYVLSAARQIASEMDAYRLIVIKSTVPVGTSELLNTAISEVLHRRKREIPYDIVSNPEFLKEGSAVQDGMKPDRIIIGAESQHAVRLMREIYSAFTVNHDRMMVMDLRSAELTKYAANAMLATRISFMNELAELCEQVGANINHVRTGIGSDKRIGYQFLYAGIGYGGSCFPKDLKALHATALQTGVDMPILEAVEHVNQRQRILFAEKIIAYFKKHQEIEKKTLALWGLSFKPDTDDMREAPSLTLIELLNQAGFSLKLFDPVANANAQKVFPPSETICYCRDEYEAADGADGIVLITEWKQFRFVNFDRIFTKLKGRAFFDGRNQYKPQEMAEQGFDYFCVGIKPPKILHSLLEGVVQ